MNLTVKCAEAYTLLIYLLYICNPQLTTEMLIMMNATMKWKKIDKWFSSQTLKLSFLMQNSFSSNLQAGWNELMDIASFLFFRTHFEKG